MDLTELHPVSIDALYDGMMVDFEIYYIQKGEPVLLCKDVVLTKKKIDALKSSLRIGNSMYLRNVYMRKENRDRLLRETSYFEVVQMQIEQTVGYDVLKDIAKDFVHQAFENGIVPMEITDALSNEIQKKLLEFDNALILQCLNGIRGIDEYLYTHCLNVGFLSGLLAGWCGYDDDYVVKLIKAGLVHDLGKLKISPSILNKPARLSSLEFDSVKLHPEFGHKMLKESGEKDEIILEAVLHHHERINGTGYPGRFSGDEVSTGARIIAITDVYDAMIAERPYKGSSTPFVILQELVDTSFSGLDTKFVNILLKNMIAELHGRRVLLSNGAVARVEFVDSQQPKYPIVNFEGQIVKTDENLFCVRLYAG